MMRMLLYLASAIGMVAFASCTKEEVELAVSFEEIAVTELCAPVDESLTSDTFTITTQEEYEALTACTPEAPEIDFSKRYIMGGWMKVDRCGGLESQLLQIRKTTLHYEVDIVQGACPPGTEETIESTVYYMVSLPVGYKKYETEFLVNVR